jgi:glycosyltransferase involved in cell wall biosynthesis
MHINFGPRRRLLIESTARFKAGSCLFFAGPYYIFREHPENDVTPEDSLVTIVIPAYNGERFLGATLTSALAQTYDPVEVIVVDDGSTDGTATLVEAIAASDNRVRFFQTQNFGAAKARNFGISKARGKLIAPLDADDLWHPEKIARQVKLMRESPAAVGLVYCWSIDIDENDGVISPIEPKFAPHGRVTAELIETNFLANSSSPLIKLSCFEAVGGYDASLVPAGAVDWKLYLALSEIYEFAVVPEYLVGYRQWNGSVSRDVIAMAQSIELVDCWLFEKWPDRSGNVKRRKKYENYDYFSLLALDNRQLWMALRYRGLAYKACPAALLKRSNLGFWFAFFFPRRHRNRKREFVKQGAIRRQLSFKDICNSGDRSGQ